MKNLFNEIFKKQFTVYFEICGKKMKTTVEADNKFHAQSIVEKKLKIIKVEPGKLNKDIDDLGDIVNMFKGK